MALTQRIADQVVRWGYGRMTRKWQSMDPEAALRRSERVVLEAFHRVARSVPAYAALLEGAGIDPASITTIEAFSERVPVIDKETVFGSGSPGLWCAGGNWHDVGSLYCSSGHSGKFSFGTDRRSAAKRDALGVEFLLHQGFGVLDRRTLVVNCLPASVKLPTRTLPVAEVGTREDVLWALLSQVGPDFEQIVLLGEPPFLKWAIEGARHHGVPLAELNLHLVTGGEYVAESLRDHLGALLVDGSGGPLNGRVLVNYGLSELATTLMWETPETAAIRRLAQDNPAFHRALCGSRALPGVIPHVMQYSPDQLYLETTPRDDGRNQLLVSLLDPQSNIPLLRYNTKDAVELLSHEHLTAALEQCKQSRLAPRFRLPLALVWGRLTPLPSQAEPGVYPEQVKEALFADGTVASAITGYFRLDQRANRPVVRVQLQPGAAGMDRLSQCLQSVMDSHLRSHVEVELVTWDHFEGGFAPDYARKIRYLAERPTSAPRHSKRVQTAVA